MTARKAGPVPSVAAPATYDDLMTESAWKVVNAAGLAVFAVGFWNILLIVVTTQRTSIIDLVQLIALAIMNMPILAIGLAGIVIAAAARPTPRRLQIARILCIAIVLLVAFALLVFITSSPRVLSLVSASEVEPARRTIARTATSAVLYLGLFGWLGWQAWQRFKA